MGADATDELLRSGREALAAADWEHARSCFEQAGEMGETAEVLDGLSQAAHFQGQYARALDLKQRAFAAYRGRGRRAEAADVARWIGFIHGMVHGNMAAAAGWMGRAEGLLEGVDECAAHGWLTLDRAPFTRDLAERERLANAALAIARRFGDADLEFAAQALLGQVYVVRGHVAEGMGLLDAAMAAISGGDVVGVGAIGDIYCRLLSACEHAGDVRRAEQWIAAADHLVAWSDFVVPTCRCHYGGILIAIGRWDEAEDELLAALRAFDGGYRAERISPIVRLAELRVRQGRFEEAERLLEGSEWHPAARRSLATIATARDDHALAEELTRLCLEGENPSDPACGPLLEFLVGVQLARHDVAAARETLDRFAELVRDSEDERLVASAELAAGRVLASEADERAPASLKAALERFSVLGLPLEAGRARLALAEALAARSPAAAIAEAGLALGAFERLGATRDADAAARFLRELGAAGRAWPRGHGTLTKREQQVLSLLATGLSNAEISGRLYISRRTAEHHVASILSKLDLRSRGEATAYAVREQPHDP